MGGFRRTLGLLSAAGSSSSSSSSSAAGAAGSLVAHLDPSTLPSFTSPVRRQKTLYEHLSQLPKDGVGTRVRQLKWAARGLDLASNEALQGPVKDASLIKQSGHLCYWEVTRARIRLTGENNKPHGKVWGRLVWRGEKRRAQGRQAHSFTLSLILYLFPPPGKPLTPEGKEERIRGGLKYSWGEAK